jgi:DNA-binding CsgD family transcriptional regulator
MRSSFAGVQSRVERLCAQSLVERELRAQVLDLFRSAIDFSYYAWLLTDPETWVGTAPLAHIPHLSALTRLIRLKYQASVNRWTALPANRWVRWSSTGNRLSVRDAEWQDLLEGFGVTDLVSVSLRDRYGSWAFLDLWRADPAAPDFTVEEIRLLDSVAGTLTRGLRRAQARSFTRPVRWELPPGPAVLVLDEQLQPVQQTASVDVQLRRLLPTAPDLRPVPAAAYNVAAQLLAAERGVDDRPPMARAQIADGAWIRVRASRLVGTDVGAGQIAVTFEAMTAQEQVELYGRASGLSLRERQLVAELVRGADTGTVAHRLTISELTVQDHLKSIFAKTGAMNRYDLITRASGAHR